MYRKVLLESFKWSWKFYCSSFTGIVGVYFIFKEKLGVEKLEQIILFGLGMLLITISVRIVFKILIKQISIWQSRNIVTSRGATILDEIVTCGLVDIEEREDKERALPPEKFYNNAEQECFILGFSAYRTFDADLKLINDLVKKRGVNVYVLLLDPKSEIVSSIITNEGKSIKSDIETTIAVIKNEGLYQKENFNVRFYDYMPPYLAVMIDGDIAKHGELAKNNQGQVRIQPCFKFSTNHKGLVVQFRKIMSKKSIFEQYSDDLRIQWENAHPRKEYFE